MISKLQKTNVSRFRCKINQLLLPVALLCTISATAQIPTITSFTPTSGSSATSVTITGTNFNTTAANNAVYFGNAKGSVTSASATSLTVTAPDAASLATVTVVNTGTGLGCASKAYYMPTFAGSSATPSYVETSMAVSSGKLNGIQFADLDGDGKNDLIVTDSSGNVKIYKNTTTTIGGAPSFILVSTLAMLNEYSSIYLGDLNNDGKPDIVVASGLGVVGVFINQSTGIGNFTFASEVSLTIPVSGGAVYAVAVGDFDGDGKQDILASDYLNNYLYIFTNNYTSGSVTASTFTRTQLIDGNTFADGYGINWMILADMDKDGKPDIVASTITNSGVSETFVIPNTTTTHGSPSVSTSTFASSSSGLAEVCVAVADFDGDGKLDVAWGDVDGSAVNIDITLNTSTGTGNFGLSSIKSINTGNNSGYLNVADLNGDGKADVIVSNYNTNGISILKNTSTGTGFSNLSFSVSSISTTAPQAFVVAADVNGDNKADIGSVDFNATGINVFRNGAVSAPAVATNAATLVTGATATLNGTINDEGATTATSFDYSSTSATLSSGVTNTAASPSSITSGAGATNVSLGLSGLAAGTTYYYRVKGINSLGTTNGNILSFTTTANIVPVFTGGSPQSLTVCQNAAATSINSLLTVNDADAGQTETWSIAAGGSPSHGSIVIGTTHASGTGVSPTGFTYQPSASYNGSDAFTMQVSDGAGGTATTLINVTVGTLPNINSIGHNSPVCSGGTLNLTSSASGGTGTLHYAWTGPSSFSALVQNPSTTAVAGIYTLAVTDANSCVATGTNTTTVAVNPNNNWTGASSTDWNTAGNWGCGTVPTASLPAVIPGSITNMPLISSGTFSVQSLSIAAGDALSINTGAILNVTGSIANAGNITGAGSLIANGTSAQTLSGKGAINNLTINNTAGVSINSGDTTYIAGVLSVSAGTLTTNNGLTLVSNASGTARIGNSAGTISGNVNVQQYFPGGRRAYRFFGHPFSVSIPLSQLETYIDITGMGGISHGFTATPSNATSCMWYSTRRGKSSLAADPGWTAFTNADGLDTNAFKQYEGIYLFIRGAKGTGLDGLPYTPLPVTVSMTGTINQGTVAIPLAKGANSDFNQVSNPYPSPVDLGSVVAAAHTAGNIVGTGFYMWSPYRATGGAFVTVPIGSAYKIQGNTSFQVEAATASSVLTFHETDKVNAADTELLRVANQYVDIEVVDANYTVWDDLKIKFDAQETDAKDNNDAGKPINPDLNFYTMSPAGDHMSIDARPYTDGKVIPLGLTTNHQQSFIIRATDMAAPVGSQLYLHDKYLATYTPLTQGTEYPFTISSDVKSQGDARFEIGLGAIPDGNNTIAGTSFGMNVTPNPATSDVAVSFHTSGKDNTTIKLINATGITITATDLGKQTSGSVHMPLNNLPAGVYMVELISGNNKTTQRLVKE